MNAQLAIELPQGQAASRAGWIHSRRFDLAFFILSPLLGFAMAASLPFHAADTALLLSLNYLIGVPQGGLWRELLNSDAPIYGGSGIGNFGAVESAPGLFVEDEYE